MEEGPSLEQRVNSPVELLKEFDAELTKFKNDMGEVCDKQENFTKELESIRSTLSGNDVQNIEQMMLIVKVYKDRLNMLRNRMLQIHSRAKNLKDRSINVQKVAVQRTADRIEKQFYEENLIKKQNKGASGSQENETKSKFDATKQ